MGSTDLTPDQGGSGGSDGIERDGWPMRRVAAEARRVLLDLASERLGYSRRGAQRKRWQDLGSLPTRKLRYLCRARRR